MRFVCYTDDNMDVGDEGQCCNDDNGSTCSATMEQYGDTERALYPCSRGSRGSRADKGTSRMLHRQLEDGEVEDGSDSTYNMSYRSIHNQKHGESANGSPVRHTSTSSSSSPAHNSSNTSVNSSEEDDDCSDFEVMINRRRRSASNTETVEGGNNNSGDMGGAGAAAAHISPVLRAVPATAPAVYVVDDDDGEGSGAVNSAVLDDAASAYSDMDDQLLDE